MERLHRCPICGNALVVKIARWVKRPKLKRRAGRPPRGERALTNAQKVKAYRERKREATPEADAAGKV